MRLHELALGFALLGAVTGCAHADTAPATAPSGGAPAEASRSLDATAIAKRDEAPNDGVRGNFPAPEPPAPPPPPPPGGSPASTTPAKANAAQGAPQNRDFVIYTAQFTMAVYQVDTGIAAIEKIAREANGYLAAKKDREIIIRVPRAQFEAAVAKVDKVGDVLHRDIAALDVTDEHVDLEIRIKNARAMQKQLTELLSRANVKEALEIEKELGRVTEELERLEGRLKLLNDKIAFSTIMVTFEARGQALTTQRVRLPFPWLNTLNLPSLLNLGEEK
ncbi:MAG: DUF4349 domain-containing protein [Labilithrix sp.]